MAASITVTKVDNQNFNVKFSSPIEGPSGVTPGSPIPLEWLIGVLEYYAKHQDASGAVDEQKIQKIKGVW